jgi:hypothetical protein
MIDCVNSSGVVLGVEGLLALGLRPSGFMVDATTGLTDESRDFKMDLYFQHYTSQRVHVGLESVMKQVLSDLQILRAPPPPPEVAAAPRPVIPTVVPSIPPVSHLVALDTAGGGAGFKGGDSAPKDMERGGRINLAKAQSHFDTKFRFAPPGAPCFRDLVRKWVGTTRAAVHSSVQARAFEDEEFSAVFDHTMGRLGDVSVDCAAGWLTLGPRPSFLWRTVAPASGGAIRLCRTWRRRVELTWRGRSHFDTKSRVTPRGAPRLDDASVDCAAGSGAEFRLSPLALGHFSASCFGVHLRELHVSEVS